MEILEARSIERANLLKVGFELVAIGALFSGRSQEEIFGNFAHSYTKERGSSTTLELSQEDEGALVAEGLYRELEGAPQGRVWGPLDLGEQVYLVFIHEILEAKPLSLEACQTRLRQGLLDKAQAALGEELTQQLVREAEIEIIGLK